jgi:hypothetical protein
MLRHRSLFPNFTKSAQCNSKPCQINHNDGRGNAAKFKANTRVRLKPGEKPAFAVTNLRIKTCVVRQAINNTNAKLIPWDVN